MDGTREARLDDGTRAGGVRGDGTTGNLKFSIPGLTRWWVRRGFLQKASWQHRRLSL